MSSLLSAAALFAMVSAAAAQEAPAGPKVPEKAELLSSLYGPDAALPAEEQYSKLAFGLAGCVALVEVLPHEAPGRQMWRSLKVRVIEEYRGFQTPNVMLLNGMDGEDARRYPAGSRWLVAANCDSGTDAAGVLEILPDSPDNRRAVSEWTVPGWKLAPLVVVARIARMGDPKIEWKGPVFSVTRVLRGEKVPAEFRENERDFEKFRPFAPGDGLYILGLNGVWLPPNNKMHLGWVRSMAPVAEKDIEAIAEELRASHFGKLQDALRKEEKDLAALEEAWRFHCAPLVAEVKVSVADEFWTGLGGRHLSYHPTRMVRGEADLKSFPFPPAPDVSGAGLRPRPTGLFYGGGHGCFGQEKIGDEFLAAGWKIGGRLAARLPLNDANRELVRLCLAQQPAPLACKPVLPDFFAKDLPTPAKERPAEKAETALFERRVSLRAALAHPRWCCFEVAAVRWQFVSYSRSIGALQARRISGEGDLRSFYYPSDSTKLPDVRWQFEGISSDERPAWREGSQWWGAVLDAKGGSAPDSRPLPPPAGGSENPAEGKAFLPGTFLPARFPYTRGLPSLAQALALARELK